MSTREEMRKGFEEQRSRGINVDWFTWQIAWQAARAAALEDAALKIDAHMRKQYGETRGAGDAIRSLAKAEGDGNGK
ncbi:hypothetical protein WCQ02_31335 [Paraburkholderia tropica]|uniref:hypothetical protein n=1 Tax=Paraburkholderia tropica TaxID=92647 RepID=UPI00301ABC47